MSEAREILHSAFVLKKAYESIWEDISDKYGLTRAEIDVLAFLSNNPKLDTASSVVEYRMIAKSHVSKAVEHLISRGFIIGNKDSKDRRQIHLVLTENAAEAVHAIRSRQKNFVKMLNNGITEEEFKVFKKIFEKLISNIDLITERESTSTEE